jgi:hypothetical protein
MRKRSSGHHGGTRGTEDAGKVMHVLTARRNFVRRQFHCQSFFGKVCIAEDSSTNCVTVQWKVK